MLLDGALKPEASALRHPHQNSDLLCHAHSKDMLGQNAEGGSAQSKASGKQGSIRVCKKNAGAKDKAQICKENAAAERNTSIN